MNVEHVVMPRPDVVATLAGLVLSGTVGDYREAVRQSQASEAEIKCAYVISGQPLTHDSAACDRCRRGRRGAHQLASGDVSGLDAIDLANEPHAPERPSIKIGFQPP